MKMVGPDGVERIFRAGAERLPVLLLFGTNISLPKVRVPKDGPELLYRVDITNLPRLCEVMADTIHREVAAIIGNKQ